MIRERDNLEGLEGEQLQFALFAQARTAEAETVYKDAVEGALAAALGLWAPPPRLTVSEWADKYRQLPPEDSAEPGQWTTSRAEYQREIMDSFTDPTVDSIVVMSSAQVGKALALDTPLPTPSGWTTMGEVRAGDQVIGRDGKPCTVVGATEVMHGRDCFEVEFSDGSVLTADADHQWFVESDLKFSNGQRAAVINTRQIAASFKYRGRRNRYAIPVADPLELPPIELPFSPYVLGLWLGDGTVGKAEITMHASDHEILEYIHAEGFRTSVSFDRRSITTLNVCLDRRPPGVCLRGHSKRPGRADCDECGRIYQKQRQRGVRGNAIVMPPVKYVTGFHRLQNMGVLHHKHIPEQYLRSSYEQRLALLQGLMDSDGHATTKGICEITLTCKPLVEGVFELVASLGFKPVITESRSKINGRDCGARWRIVFMPYSERPVFRLSRKLARQRSQFNPISKPTETLRRRIVDVRPIPSVPVRCIAVDSADNLYLAGRTFIPTHNTAMILNAIGFIMHQDPGPMLVLQPTKEMAEVFSKDRLAPMIRDTPALAAMMGDARSRDKKNTIWRMQFPGGQVSMVGANSPAGLASRPIRIVLADEVDRYPPSAGEEGDPLLLAVKRTTTFWNRKKFFVSTPTTKGHSRIEKLYLQSDQRKRYAVCPHCAEEQELVWLRTTEDGKQYGVIFDKEHPENARYACKGCGALWTDSERWEAARAGRWVATAPFNGVRGYHMNQLISPFVTLADCVREFLEAKRTGRQAMRVWVNTVLGETFEEQGERISDNELMARRTDYSVAPGAVQFVTAGVDVQADRLEVELVGWAANDQSYGLGKFVLWGETANGSGDVWAQLDALLLEPIKRVGATPLRVQAAAVDSQYNTQVVANWCRDRWGRRVWAIRGVAGEGKPIWPAKVGKRSKTRLPFFNVGVDTAKDTVYARLRVADPTAAGYCHFNMTYDESHFEQLTSEEVRTTHKRGMPVRSWHLKPGHLRNEALDCRAYALAAFEGLKLMGARVRKPAEAPAPAAADGSNAAQVQPPAPPPPPAKKRAPARRKPTIRAPRLR